MPRAISGKLGGGATLDAVRQGAPTGGQVKAEVRIRKPDRLAATGAVKAGARTGADGLAAGGLAMDIERALCAFLECSITRNEFAPVDDWLEHWLEGWPEGRPSTALPTPPAALRL
jgi:hypothetical protein